VLNDSDKVLPKEQSGHSGSHCSQNDIPAVVEFGAGRGYLTQILADCYGIKKVFLVERKSYKLKVIVRVKICIFARLSLCKFTMI